MASMIVRFAGAAGARWGVLVSSAPTHPDDEIAVLEIRTDAATTGELIAALEKGLKLPDSGERQILRAAALLSPVTTDSTLVCQGLNYRTHVEETGVGERKKNLLFGKASASLTGPYGDIIRPSEVELLDYEAEVGIVLRRDLKSGDVVDDNTLGDYVAAIVLCNDISARDTMFGALMMQWYQGKSYRTFCPAGPVLYWMKPSVVSETLEEVEFSLSYKGTQRQSAKMSHMIYKPAETLTQLARMFDMKAGDMVLTGTPGGVLIGHARPGRMGEIIRTLLSDDVKRTEELRKELKSTVTYLQPGETLELSLRDGRAQRDLGGQYCRIVQGE
ncbi:2-keto-4-pentenoate hydratase/2-oxohepta-3-ene-1,7-dioic acid hydratase (catechol pathway) [Variovorax sp. HW608]|uniref:fumarylacetoacetate hydrolase family protein n=1 Tax=Variovorax sp. HW608 TaxID=1034889 RepID=UPI00081F7E94|nr:fumarylacetoacetate hydrolase family protein [Variovorax sp. HW608]SCK14521.1 2-keto-4-pentenoate hydratase/2-oxohepta-3-ene-1,7-dioic acid hydratase (catechol pathway) [Variovorax sp. HW608]